MNIRTRFAITLMLIAQITLTTMAQMPVGSWRDHLPYSNGQVVAVTPGRVYCATDLALFYYNKADHSINKLSKINKLSDLEVGYIAYSKKHNKLVIGYMNGNIDILVDDTKYNFPDIKLKNIIADKQVKHILIEGDFAYLSTGFGIVKFNLVKNEFTDTYIIGAGGSFKAINSTAIYNNRIYALTDNGIYSGDVDDPFLGNHENWAKETGVLNNGNRFYVSTVFNNKLYAVSEITKNDSSHVNVYNGQVWDTIFTDVPDIRSITSNSKTFTMVKRWHVNVYNASLELIVHNGAHKAKFAVYDDDENLWIADKEQGMLLSTKTSTNKVIMPAGPKSKKVFRLHYNNGNMLVAPGGYTKVGANNYSWPDIYSFQDETWNRLLDDEENLAKVQKIRDAIDFASQSNPNRYMVANWKYGLMEIEDNKIINIYNNGNTGGILGDAIGGLTYDQNGNLYVMSNYTEYPIVVKTPDNKWYRYKYDGSWTNLGDYNSWKLINTYNNDKWTISRRGSGFFVWNDNGTPAVESDDVYSAFTLVDEANKVIDKQLNDIVQDVEGAIWIATSNGVAVYDYPEYALNSDRDFYARIPQIVVDGYLKGLLEGEIVTTIAVDGANRKWIGTDGGGLFLVSPDGTEQILTFNTDNSKLFSNNIISVSINQQTGEVFIGTDKGMQSYKSTSTENRRDFSDIYAFPNPVKGDYNGIITVRGLKYQTNVKITDLSGQLVFETLSNGGDAIWNGKDMSGNKVASGIYLVLCSNRDGTLSEATKILIVK